MQYDTKYKEKPMKKTIYLYSGEGTRNEESGLKFLKSAPIWKKIEKILSSNLQVSAEELWAMKDIHRCPHSPLLTVISQICLSEIWQSWGYKPDIVIGHSIGELSAAYQAGMYSLEDILTLTYNIGQITSHIDGGMVHGALKEEELERLQLCLAAINFPLGSDLHVTLSGLDEELEVFLKVHQNFIKMKTPHPWHHRDYNKYYRDLVTPSAGNAEEALFVSGVTAEFAVTLQQDHWQRWLSGTINFNKAIEAISARFTNDDLEIIEIGFHPVLEQCCESFQSYSYASSMYRGEDEISWILHQRRRLDASPLNTKLSQILGDFWPGVKYDAPLSYQGFTSLKFVELTALLEPFFPTLAPQDFYRFKTITQLINEFGKESPKRVANSAFSDKHQVVISAMSCKLPSSAENLTRYWEILQSGQDQVKADSARGDFEAGFLSEKTSKFDHKYFNIPEAEAKTMDPQQILALELTELLFQDAGINPKHLDRRRVGVYIGAWNNEFSGDRNSVYYPTGTNVSIIASRISYHYDFRGPSWVTNTACSSSLVAIHYACKDIEAGRVDYAIAGGVNMILGNNFTHTMRDSGFLSKDQRCKAFDDSANGYVRSEGGGLVLLVRKEFAEEYYAEVLGSSINQNGGRAQVITAPHPEAQEELILDACQDAGILPQDISYIECHGTGTKIGDPIEVSALQNSISKGRTRDCLLGSVKSNIGHLESAAGIAGLIKTVLALNHGIIPGNLHFNKANQYIDFTSHHLKVVAESTPIEKEACVGVSSFGFGGSNGHVILKGAEDAKRKPLVDRPSPFDENRATPLTAYYPLDGLSVKARVQSLSTLTDHDDTSIIPEIGELVNSLFFDLTGIKNIEADIALTDQGLDSLSATQFITSLQENLGVELDTDLLFDYPSIDQLVAHLEEIAGVHVEAETERNRQSREVVAELVNRLFHELTNIEEIDPDVELTDQGLDSLSATQFLSQLEKELKIEIDADILYANPIYDQLVDTLYASLEQ